MKIRDLVEVKPQPRVVRLEHLEGQREILADSFFETQDVARHMELLKRVLVKDVGCGVFLIGQFGSGKSHFLARFIDLVQSEHWIGPSRFCGWASLVNFSAAVSLEQVVTQVLGLRDRPRDRRDIWAAFQDQTGPAVLVLDELSEFLKSKPDSRSFHEDVRFLQFMGEWAQDHPFWVVAALQEQIEHTGEIEYDLFRKIKDRYPIRLLLTPSHIRDLISERILRKKPGYAQETEKLASQLAAAFPEADVDRHALCQLYPLHPATLDVLEEVRDRFSQTRGVIDFVLTRLLGDEDRGVSPFLDEPLGRLLTPDVVVDHFWDLFELQPEFQPLSQQVFPFFQRHMARLFEREKQQEIGWQLLKLLVLVSISPQRTQLKAAEAAAWLLRKITTIDPDRNVRLIANIMRKMQEQGAYIRCEGDEAYCLDLEDRSGQEFERHLAREIEELEGHGDSLFEGLKDFLKDQAFNPFSVEEMSWQEGIFRWHLHPRSLLYAFGNRWAPLPESSESGLALAVAHPWGDVKPLSHAFLAFPQRLTMDPDFVELAALQRISQKPLPRAVVERARERMERTRHRFVHAVQRCYLTVEVIRPDGEKQMRRLAEVPHDLHDWLSRFAELVFREVFPRFEAFAPAQGPLGREAYRQLLTHAAERDLLEIRAPEWVRLIREGYLVNLRLVRRTHGDYQWSRQMDRHELVAPVLAMAEQGCAVGKVYERFQAPPLGLVPDQIHLILICLLHLGEIDILKKGHSMRDVYENHPLPIQYDRLHLGVGLSPNALRDLDRLLELMGLPRPKTWSVQAQRRVQETLMREAARRVQSLGEFLDQLVEEGAEPQLVERIEPHLDVWKSLAQASSQNLCPLQDFLSSVAPVEPFVADDTSFAGLPEQFQGLRREVDRLRHVDARLKALDSEWLRQAMPAIPAFPGYGRLDQARQWVETVGEKHQAFQRQYRQKHDDFWRETLSHPVLRTQVPAVAHLRVLGLQSTLKGIEEARNAFQQHTCRGLSNLDFAPICHCGFDGTRAPAMQPVEQLQKLNQSLQGEIKTFFSATDVKSQVRKLSRDGILKPADVRAYLQDEAPYPDLGQITLLDQALSGVKLVHEIQMRDLLEGLDDRVWRREDFLVTLEARLQGQERFRITAAQPGAEKGLLTWCLKMCLNTGTPFPPGVAALMPGDDLEGVRPEWVSPSALRVFPELNLPRAVRSKILTWLYEGLVDGRAVFPDDGPVAVVQAMTKPTQAWHVDAWARQLFQSYLHDSLLRDALGTAWDGFLKQLNGAALNPPPPLLVRELEHFQGAQWIVVDALGAAIWPMMEASLAGWFPAHCPEETRWCRTESGTRTETFYVDLLDAGHVRSFEKVNAVDRLIHEREGDFVTVLEVAKAELTSGFRHLESRIDPSRTLILFGDHGFALVPEGPRARFRHGGGSTAEQVVPLFVLKPGA